MAECPLACGQRSPRKGYSIGPKIGSLAKKKVSQEPLGCELMLPSKYKEMLKEAAWRPGGGDTGLCGE